MTDQFEFELPPEAESGSRAPKNGETILLHDTCKLDRLATVVHDDKQYAVRGKDVQQALNRHINIVRKCLRYYYSDATKNEYVWIFTTKTGGSKLFLGPQAPTGWVVVKKHVRAFSELTTPDQAPPMPTWRFSNLTEVIQQHFEIIDSLDHPVAKQLLSEASVG